MFPLKRAAGVVFLTTSFFIQPCTLNRNLDDKIQKTTFMEYNIDEEEANLKCSNAAKIHASDFFFYACESDITPSLISNLEYIAAVKKYAKERFEMEQTSNYVIYKNRSTDFPKTEYRLYMAPEFAIPQKFENFMYIPQRGNYTIDIGSHAIFYSLDEQFINDEVYYKSKGYDTLRMVITNFNDGCNLDPVFFSKDPISQANLVLHEDWHETTRSTGRDSMLDESISTLIGNIGAIDFTREYFGENSREHNEAIKKLAFWVDFSEKVVEYNSRLQDLYKKDIPRGQKLIMKSRILSEFGDHEMNNSYIWAYLPYTKNFLLLYEVYKKNPDIDKLLEILSSIPRSEDKGVKYLEDILKSE